MKIKLTKKRKNRIWLLVMVVTLVAGLLTTYHYIKHPEALSITISPYCKTLPTNAQNVLELQKDINGCPHWFFQFETLTTPCCCYGSDKQCGGGWVIVPHVCCYPSGDSGCFGREDCSTYTITSISDYGGLIDGYDCTNDLNCSNSSIILKSCINGNYVDTGNTCPTICPQGQNLCPDGTCKSDCNPKINVYRFENNKCTLININSSEKLSNDYNTQEECQVNIVPPVNYFIIVIIILVIGGIVYGLYFLYIKTRKKHK